MSRGFLLDTNVVSELTRSKPELRVEEWFKVQSESDLYLSVVTVGELIKGIHLLAPGKRRSNLERWLYYDLVPRFESRILPVTYAIAERWGILESQCQQNGHDLKTADVLIAATATQHDLVLATRDIDFSKLDLTVFNPWR